MFDNKDQSFILKVRGLLVKGGAYSRRKIVKAPNGLGFMKSMAIFKNFMKDESGQTTTEYILILAVIVTIFMQFRTKLTGMLGKVFKQLDSATEDVIQEE
ncbi:MAG: hypothetical protein EOP11_08700 [Proteobacteria bacterium]|nr:MAG: hypothetical protein EOP11_08700 [Pseudomonadota bacterium]